MIGITRKLQVSPSQYDEEQWTTSSSSSFFERRRIVFRLRFWLSITRREDTPARME